MSRRRIAAAIGILVLVLAGAGYHLLIGHVRVQHLSPEISVLTRKSSLRQIGANIVVYAGQKDSLVVDTQLPALGSRTRAAVADVSLTPVTTVIVTHWHPDHSGGIAAFSSAANVVAHANVAQRLSSPQEGFGLTKPGSHHEFAARAAEGLPNQSIGDRLALKIGIHSVHVEHYPVAHTDGDVAVFFHDAKIVAVGDLLWPESFPFVDLHNGGTVSGLENAIQGLLDNSDPDYRFVPGHGLLMTFEQVHSYYRMVSGSRRWVEAQLDTGKSAEDLIASTVPPQWQSWESALVPWRVWVRSIIAAPANGPAAAD